MKRIALITVCALLLSITCGCWDYTEVNMQDYVFGIGIDMQDDAYNVSIETLKVRGSAEQAGSQGTVIKTRGANLFDAIRAAITHAGKKLYWGHFQLVILGESVAAEHLQQVLDVFSRAQDVYLNAAVLVTHGASADEILNAKLPNQGMVTDHIMDIFDNEKPSRHFRLTEIWQIYRDTSFSDTFTLPTVSMNDDDIPEINGFAVFRSGKPVGYFTGDEGVIYSLLTRDSSGGYLPEIQVTPELGVSLEISQNRISTKAEFKDGKPELHIKSEILVSLSRVDGNCNMMDEHTQTLIGSAAQKTVYARMQALTDRIRSENLGDPLHWARHVHSENPKWWRENRKNWDKIMRTMPIHWDVRLSLNSAGMTKHTLAFN